MDDYEKILTLENECEAHLLGSALEDHGIPHLIRTYHDTAYDGLFQFQMGWGHLEAPPCHRDEILEIFETLKALPVDTEPDRKIYFAGSIRGGRQDQDLYRQIIGYLATRGTVLTEHVGDSGMTLMGDNEPEDPEIYRQDMGWLTQSELIVAEVTIPSHGVGYEIAKAEDMGKPILCLHRPEKDRKVSAMLTGSPHLEIREYRCVQDAMDLIDAFLDHLDEISRES